MLEQAMAVQLGMYADWAAGRTEHQRPRFNMGSEKLRKTQNVSVWLGTVYNIYVLITKQFEQNFAF